MKEKIHRFLWVVLLVISAFILGLYLNINRPSNSGGPFSGGRPAPPLRFAP